MLAPIGNELAIEHEVGGRKRLQRLDDGGEPLRVRELIARPQLHIAIVAYGNAAKAVELALVLPFVGGRQFFGQLRQHGRAPLRRRRGFFSCLLVLAGTQLVERETRHHRRRRIDREVDTGSGGVVALFHHEPRLVVGRIEAHKRPASLQFVSMELDRHVPGVDGGTQVDNDAVFFGDIANGAFIPDNHGAGAVVTGRNQTFEMAIVERVIFGVYSQALLRRVGRRALRHGPRRQHTVDLEADVVVHASRCVLLHHENRIAGRRRTRCRFRRLVEVAHGAVLLEVVAVVHAQISSGTCVCSLSGPHG